MLEVIHVFYNSIHEDTFVYHESGCNRDWWLLLQTHSPAYFM